MLTLSLGSSDALLDYVGRQLDNFFPDGRGDAERPALQAYLEPALRRLERCIAEVRMWTPGRFDPPALVAIHDLLTSPTPQS